MYIQPFSRASVAALMFALSFASVPAVAESIPSGSPPDRAALEAALRACEASLSKETDGRPNPQAMDSCMSAKGFIRPTGGPQMERGAPPSPR